jgi:hypothetical protein
MALIRFPIKKALITALGAGLLSLGAAGAAGAAATTLPATTAPATAPATAAPAAPKAAHPVNCANVQARLTRMHRRQTALSTRLLRLSASGSRAAKAGKDRRLATIHRNLAHWQKIQARIINTRFLRQEAKFAALAAGQCRAATSSTVPPAITT